MQKKKSLQPLVLTPGPINSIIGPFQRAINMEARYDLFPIGSLK